MLNKTIQLHFTRQMLVKLVLFVAAMSLCMKVFAGEQLSMFQDGWRSSKLITGVIFLSFTLTAVQCVFLTPVIIHKMSFFLRVAAADSLSIFTVLKAGSLFHWFHFSVSMILIFSFVFSVVFLASIVGIHAIQAHGFTGVFAILRTAAVAVKKFAVAVITAFILGMASGYRGSQELNKPWDMPETSITELDDIDRENEE